MKRRPDELTSAADLKRAFASVQESSARLQAAFHSMQSSIERVVPAGGGALDSRSLEHILQILPVGVVVLDGVGRVRSANPVARRLLGEGLREGALWRDVVSRGFAPRWDDGHDITLVGGQRVNLSTQALGHSPGQVVVLTDVSETRQLQDQVSRQARSSAQGEMAAALAHQVRTPLASALLYASNLDSPVLDEHRRRRFVRALRERLVSIEHVVEQMLAFARSRRLDVTPMSLEELWREFQQQVDSDDSFTVHWPAAVPTARIAANRAGLLGVMHNLVNNARQACAGRGCLTLSFEDAYPGIVSIHFTDSGPGIPEAQREQIFQPFQSTREHGTGLGLSVARAVAQAHGGGLSVAPSAAGACFVLSLPVLEEAAAPPLAPAAAAGA